MLFLKNDNQKDKLKSHIFQIFVNYILYVQNLCHRLRGEEEMICAVFTTTPIQIMIAFYIYIFDKSENYIIYHNLNLTLVLNE
jgi:hypothetical protein